MPDSVPDVDVLAGFTLAVQHPLTRSWVGDNERLVLLAEEHDFDLRLATDLELARDRADRLGLDQPPAALLNRWLPLSRSLDALVSIRFQGGDPRLPFVDATVTSRLVSADDLPGLAAVAERTYPGFGCRRLRFWAPGPMGAVAGTTPDLRVLAAPLSTLVREDVPADLWLAPTVDDRHLAEAAAAYAASAARHRGHAGQARIIDAQSLAEAVTAGTMFDVWWQGSWSGYAGTLPESQLGLPAQVVQELLLTPPARGRGLGRHLSNLLAAELPADGRVLSGTIHGDNVGAIRAARSAGRTDIGGWSWWPLETGGTSLSATMGR